MRAGHVEPAITGCPAGSRRPPRDTSSTEDRASRAAWLALFAVGLAACNSARATADAGAASSSTPSAAVSGPVVAAAAVQSGAAPGSAPAVAGATPDYCKVCSPPVARATVTSRNIKENSGLVASAVHADVFYAHNDSGDGPRFFAVSAAGGDLGTFTIADAEARDWEDIARGPCEGGRGSCLYLGDFGDNFEKRDDCVIYRVAEPQELGPGDKQLQAERIPFAYPDGRHNAETLLVHPDSGVLTIVTKVAFGNSTVFEFPMPLTPGQRMTLKQTAAVSPGEGSPRYTGGDVHPRGSGVLLRTYTSLFFYPMRAGQSVADALAGSACAVPDADEEQGEAVAWLRSGGGYATLSEGTAQKLNVVECAGR
jgi:hypothetical protein